MVSSSVSMEETHLHHHQKVCQTSLDTVPYHSSLPIDGYISSIPEPRGPPVVDAPWSNIARINAPNEVKTVNVKYAAMS